MKSWIRVFLAFLLIFYALGCGNRKKAKTDQQGFIVKGPIQSSRVKVYRLQGSPLNRRDLEDEGVTGPDGSFTLKIDKDYRGYLLFEASGGNYQDELSNFSIPAAQAHYPFSAIIEKKSDDLPILYLTPFSTLKVQLAVNSTEQYQIQSLLDGEAFINQLFGFIDAGQIEYKRPVLTSIHTSSPGTVAFDSFLIAKHLATLSEAASQDITDGIIDSLDAVNQLHFDILDGNWDGLIGKAKIESFISPNQFLKAFRSVAVDVGGMSTDSILLTSIMSSLVSTTSFYGFQNVISPITTTEFNLSSEKLLHSMSSPDQLIQLNENHYLVLSKANQKGIIFQKLIPSILPTLVQKQQIDLPNYTSALAMNLSDQSIMDVVFLSPEPDKPLQYALSDSNNQLKPITSAVIFTTITTPLTASLVSGQFTGPITSSRDLLFWDVNRNLLCIQANGTALSTCSMTIETIIQFEEILVADLNQDAYDDLIFTGAKSHSVSNTSVVLYINSNGFSFHRHQVIEDRSKKITTALIQDLSGDNLPDLLFAKHNGELEYFQQSPDHSFNFVQTLLTNAFSQVTLIPFETNGSSPKEVLLTFRENNQTKLYGIKKTSRETLSKTTSALIIEATQTSFLSSRYTSDTLDDLLYTDKSRSQILIRTHKAIP